MNLNFINILRCPITKMKLGYMDDSAINNINFRIAKTEIYHYGGEVAQKQIDSALISENGQFIYPIEDGIVLLMESLALVADPDVSFSSKQYDEKKLVQYFYDDFGWRQDENGNFLDAVEFEDLREVSAEYIRKCHLRVKGYLKPNGKYFLDVASGPIQYPEYLTYSDEFSLRICVDISILALKAAREKLGDRGAYILGDITNLPFLDDIFDGIVSLHTIYHVPKEEQPTAFGEIYRVLKPGSTAVVVYGWGKHAVISYLTFPLKIKNKFISIIKNKNPTYNIIPILYFYAYSYKWFINHKWPFTYKICVWRSIDVAFLKAYIHRLLCGKWFIDIIYRLEEKYPQLAGKIGCYPIIVIYK
jgi:ubiquinone/menaquinone biosynthesis C-methylase UbiE/uncharacterized protein YbaR (Trm112 family)